MSKLIGANALIARLKAVSKETQEDVIDVVEEITLSILRQAKANAPSAGDRLDLNSSNIGRRSQNSQKTNTNISSYIQSDFKIEQNKASGTVFIEAGATELAIYIEFGTGSSAAGYVPTLPKEFQEIAKRYYINGRGTIVKKPFLLPAYFAHEAIFIRKLKEALKGK